MRFDKEKLESILDKFYLKTLIGFALEKNTFTIFKNTISENEFLVLTPFIFPLGEFGLADLNELFDKYQKHFFVLDKSENDLEKYKSFYIQKRVHFLDHRYTSTNISKNIKEIDENLFQEIMKAEKFQNHLRHYDSFDEFKIYGAGSCYIQKGQILSVASAFCYYDREIEIQVDTLKGERGNGFGFEVAASLINQAYNKGLKSRWDAATDVSANLGRKLGFFYEKTYFMLCKHPPPQ